MVVPVVVTRDNLLLDGHRRLEAAIEAGLSEIPTRMLNVEGEATWSKAFAIALNLRRRHLNEAQRADLASSLLRVERAKAKERQREAGAFGEQGGRGNKKNPLDDAEAEGSRKPTRATNLAARAVGVSRQTIERVERVKKANPELANRMLAGKISIAGAARKVAVEDIKRRLKSEAEQPAGLVKDLAAVEGKYACVYADPPWAYSRGGHQGDASEHYPTLEVQDLCRLPVSPILNAEGGFLWLWTTWPKIRDRAPHAVMEAWDFRWVGEVVWNKQRMATGKWFRAQTEILCLGVRGRAMLLDEPRAGYLEVLRGRHSEKPEEARSLIERLCPGPRIELFARKSADGWDRWGLEA